MKRILAVLFLAGCATPPARWEESVDDAVARATREGRPLYVLSVFGDLSKRC